MKTTPSLFLIRFSLALFIFAAAAVAVQGQTYTITDLGDAYVGDDLIASNLNDTAEIVGCTFPGSGTEYAFQYECGVLNDLGTLGSPYTYGSTASAINNSGAVVGLSYATGLGSPRAFLYNGAMSDLGTLGGSYSGANSINNSGQIVGWSDTTGNAATHAFLYQASSGMTDLGTLPGRSSSTASHVNNNGQIVGTARTSGGNGHFFLYNIGSGGPMSDLGTLPGASGGAQANWINDNGQVVGFSSTAAGPQHAALYDIGSAMWTDLGSLSSGQFSTAISINNNGQIVGISGTSGGSSHAFLYSGGAMHDLNDYNGINGSGWVLVEATAINNNGQIVGFGLNPNGDEDAFLLTPGTNECLIVDCPTNIVVSACTNVPVFYSPTAQDICCGAFSTNVTCSPPSGSYFAVGTTTTVTCSAADGDATNDCPFTVTVLQSTNCATNYLQVECPSNIVVVSCTNIPVSYAPSVTDSACSNWSVILSPPSGSYFAPGTTTLVDCFVSDDCGLTNDCTFTVTVSSGTNCPTNCLVFQPGLPEAAPTNIVVTSCTNVPVYYSLSITDVCCTNWSVIYLPPSGTYFAPGTTTNVTVLATDSCGDSNSWDFTVTVLPGDCATNYLQVECPSNIVVTSCTNVPVFYAPSVTDSACSNWTVTLSPPSGSYFAPGTTTLVDCFVNDDCGLTNDCSFEVTVLLGANCATNSCGCGTNASGAPVGLASFTTLYSFTGATNGGDGAFPNAGVIQGLDGALYGTTLDGGNTSANYSAGMGTVFRINTNGADYSVLYRFTGSGGDGLEPVYGSLVQGLDGGIYGTTEYGGGANHYGTVFRINTNGASYSVLYSFTDSGGDGGQPVAGLVQGLDGALYGTAQLGGPNLYGTVFTIGTNGSGYSVLYGFDGSGADGAYPYATLVQGSDGGLYGTTSTGEYDYGAVFRSGTNGAGFSVLHGFTAGSGSTGAFPKSGVIQGSDGALYGTTYDGGVYTSGAIYGEGTVFRVGTNGSGFSILYAFTGSAGDGAEPFAPVVQGRDGALYGTTQLGGAYGMGTVFRIGTNGSGYTVLYSFSGSGADGANPIAGLVQGGDGALYGTTLNGGTAGRGTVFALTFTNAATNCLEVECPTNIIVAACANVQEFYAPVVTDLACSNWTVVCTPPSGSYFAPDTTNEVNCLVTDCCGYSNTCSFTVTVLVCTNCLQVVCPTNKTIPCGDTNWTFDAPIATSCCTNDFDDPNGPATNVLILPISTVTNGGCPAALSITRTWQISDLCGNVTNCSQTVIITACCSNPCLQLVSNAPTVFVGYGGTQMIEEFDSQGVGTLFASAGVFDPIAMAFDSAGNLYVANYDYIEKYDSHGVGTVFASTGVVAPVGLAFDAAGNLYVSYQFQDLIEKFDPSGVGTVYANSGMDAPEGLAFDSAGNLYVANAGAGAKTILKIDHFGVPTLFASSTPSLPLDPHGMAVDSAGNVYVSNQTVQNIVKFTPAGVGTVFASVPVPQFMAFDGADNLYVADQYGPIYKIDPSGVITTFANAGNNAPIGVALQNGPPVAGPTNIVVTSCTNIPVYYSLSITDVCCTNWSVTYIPPSGTYFAPGTTTDVIVGASDSCGNSNRWDFTVTVLPGTNCPANSCGCTNASCAPAGLASFTTLYSFTGPTNGGDGTQPWAGVIQGNDGALYGTTTAGGNTDSYYTDGMGTVFRIDTNGANYTVLYRFTDTAGDGQRPMYGSLCQGSDGGLYGTTLQGTSGTPSSGGVIFRIDTNGADYAVLYDFTINSGADPLAGLVQGLDGALYGTASDAGPNRYGTVFTIGTNGAGFNVLYSFDGFAPDDAYPYGTLIQGSDAGLYGTTWAGANNSGNFALWSWGAVFRIGTNGAGFSVLYTFSGIADTGVSPDQGVVQGSDGGLYGTTANSEANNAGGISGAGEVFQIGTNGGAISLLHTFSGALESGLGVASLIQGRDGALYGTTEFNGANNLGTVFRICTNGSGYSVLYSFSGADGAYPLAPLMQGRDGALYGTTRFGGSAGLGTVFRLTFTNAVTNCLQVECPSNILVSSCTNVQEFYAPVVADPACSNWTVTLSPPSGSYFAPGTTNVVNCLVTDCCGDSNACSFTVTVLPGTNCCGIECCGPGLGLRTINWLELPTNGPLAPNPTGANGSGTWLITNLPCYGNVLITQDPVTNVQVSFFKNADFNNAPNNFGEFDFTMAGYGPYSWGTTPGWFSLNYNHAGTVPDYTVSFYFLDGAPNPCALVLAVIGLAEYTTNVLSQPVTFRSEYDLTNSSGALSAYTALNGSYETALIPGVSGTVVSSAYSVDGNQGDDFNTGWAFFQPDAALLVTNLPPGSGSDLNGNPYPTPGTIVPYVTFTVSHQPGDGFGLTVGYICCQPCPTNCLAVTCPTNKTVSCGTTWTFDEPVAHTCCTSNIPGTQTNLMIVSTGLSTNGLCPQVITQGWLITDGCGSSGTCTQTVTVVDTNAPIIQCQTNVYVVALNSNCDLVIPPITATASDPCTPYCDLKFSQSPTNGTIIHGTNATVIVTVTNLCGNSASCPVRVEGVPKTGLVVDWPANVVSTNCLVPCVNVTAVDCACPLLALLVTQSPECGQPIGPGVSSILVTVTDCNNTRQSRRIPLTVAGEESFLGSLTNTGVGLTGALLPASAVDPHYTLDLAPLTPPPGFTAPNAVVVDNVWGTMESHIVSRWIAPTTYLAPGYDLAHCVTGDYIYTNHFTLPAGAQPATATLSGRWAADKGAVQMKLNGVVTGNTIPGLNGYTGWTPFTINSGFVSGLNTILFVVTNRGPSPTGLRVEYLSANVCSTCAPPAIVSMSGSGTLQAGSTATMSVEAVGVPPLTYQWQFNNLVIAGATNATLQIQNVDYTAAGLYSVSVSNPCGGGGGGGGGIHNNSTFAEMALQVTSALPWPNAEWNVADLSNPLGATYGPDLILAGESETTNYALATGTTEDFGLPDPAGQIVNVMDINPQAGATILLPPVTAPGATADNSFTLIMDIYEPDTSLGTPSTLYASASCCVSNLTSGGQDGLALTLDESNDVHLVGSAGGLPFDNPSAAPLAVDTWNRLALVSQSPQDGIGGTLSVYLNGQIAINPCVCCFLQITNITGIRWTNNPPSIVSPSMDGVSTNAELYVSSIQFHAIAMTPTMIAGIGSPDNGPSPVNETLIGASPALSAAWSNGVVNISWTGSPYTLQETKDLSCGVWTDSQLPFTETVGSTGNIVTTAVAQPATGGPSRFYRLVFRP